MLSGFWEGRAVTLCCSMFGYAFSALAFRGQAEKFQDGIIRWVRLQWCFCVHNFIDLLLADIKLPVTEPPVLLPQIFETLDSSVSDLFALIS